MVKFYLSGLEFMNEQLSFIGNEPLRNSFFYLDAPLITDFSTDDFAIAVVSDHSRLVAMQKSPYCLLLYGELNLVDELVAKMVEEKLKINHILCDSELGIKFCETLKKYKNIDYSIFVSLEYMSCDKIILPSSPLVIKANKSHLLELVTFLNEFKKELDLVDMEVNEKTVLSEINSYRLVVINNKIVSIARRCRDTDDSVSITNVYTVPSERGKGYAKLCVNSLKNEIIEDGKTANLNVDVNNAISSHIYQSLGFEKIFDQVEIRISSKLV